MLGHDAEGQPGLSEELGGAENDEEYEFASERLRAFEAGLDSLELIVRKIVVDVAADASMAIVGSAGSVVLQGIEGSVPGCRKVRWHVDRWLVVSRRDVIVSGRDIVWWIEAITNDEAVQKEEHY